MLQSSTTEKVVWEDSPSQVLNLGVFVLCGLFCWLVIPLFYALWKWLEIRCTKLTLTTERIRIKSGILSKELEDLELYRVKDFSVQQPWHLRLFGLSNIVLVTSDRSHPILTLQAVAKGEALKDVIRERVEDLRRQRGVREFD